MHDIPLTVVMTGLGMLAGIAAAWGRFSSRADHQDRRLAELTETDKRQAEQIGELRAELRVLVERVEPLRAPRGPGPDQTGGFRGPLAKGPSPR